MHSHEKYANVDRYALQAFKGCHDRVRDGKSPSIFWPRTREGYLAFCVEIGPKPDNVSKWSVGRIKHELGYEPGNIQWEEHRFNSVKRRGTKYSGVESPKVELRSYKFRKGTPEHIEHQRAASNARWAKQREQQCKSN